MDLQMFVEAIMRIVNSLSFEQKDVSTILITCRLMCNKITIERYV